MGGVGLPIHRVGSCEGFWAAFGWLDTTVLRKGRIDLLFSINQHTVDTNLFSRRSARTNRGEVCDAHGKGLSMPEAKYQKAPTAFDRADHNEASVFERHLYMIGL